MTTSPKKLSISVVICAYNEEDWIIPTLASLLHQRRLPDEIIIVDNASTDNTAQRVQQFLDSHSNRIIKLVHEPKKGLHQARDTGWRASTGDIIVSTDADMVFPENWLAIIETTFANPDIHAITGAFRYTDALPIADWVTGMNDAQRAKAENTHLNGGNSAIRRHVLEEVDGYVGKPFDEFEDQFLSKKIHAAGYSILFLPELRLGHTFRRFNKDGLWGYIKYIFFYTAENIYPDHLSSESPYTLAVIVPTLNAEKTIVRCLQSLMRQESCPHEVIVVDRGSTDNTINQVETVRCDNPNANIQILHRHNLQSVQAFVEGWRAATSDLILRIAPDEQLPHDCLQKIHAAFICHPDIEAVGGEVRTTRRNLIKWLLQTMVNFRNRRRSYLAPEISAYKRSLLEQFLTSVSLQQPVTKRYINGDIYTVRIQ